MADNVPLTLVEGNDETISFSIVPETAGDDLTGVASLRLVLKAEGCDDDADAEVVLTTADPTEMVILTHTATQITGEAYLPALTEPYRRLYRIDAITSAGSVRTALYGRVTVTNL